MALWEIVAVGIIWAVALTIIASDIKETAVQVAALVCSTILLVAILWMTVR